MTARRILIADDDAMLRDLLVENLELEGYSVDAVVDGEEAIAALKNRSYEIMLTDLRMPGLDGIEVLHWIRNEKLPTVGILMTGFGSIDSAIEAMKAGAFHYITKPLDFGEVRLLVRKAADFLELREENVALREQIRRLEPRHEDIVGVSTAMRRVFELVETVAATDSTVLILGESGTGKEIFARSIHSRSARAQKPMIIVNCAAIPETMLESELFGHVRGAFTGATADRPGRFRSADGGTIFLDEIAEMSPALQVKLLRVLQEQAFEPVGASESVTVNVRVIAATNRDLDKEVRNGGFREDLFYRLNVIPISLPPLRERPEDIVPLITHFSQRLAERTSRRVAGFDAETLDIMQRYHWPGNVRELENLVERMVALHSGRTVTPADLPEAIRREVVPTVAATPEVELPPNGVDLPETIDRVETALVRQALRRADGVKSRAAELLGIKRTTLVQKMKRKGLE